MVSGVAEKSEDTTQREEDSVAQNGQVEGGVQTEQKIADDTTKEPENTGIPVFIKTLAEIGTIQVQVTIHDTVQDIKQFLFETADTCYFTSFDIYLDGVKLNEFTELSNIKGVEPNCTFEMKEASYDERSSRLHVRRVREILSMSFLSPSLSPSVFSYYNLPEESEKPESSSSNAKKNNKDKNAKAPVHVLSPKTPLLSEMSAVHIEAPLSEYYPPPPSPAPSCVKDIVFSSFNPPPGYRRLLGDLFYLEITTLENSTYYVTAWDWGFFVNSTSGGGEFNPAPKNLSSYTLVGLLGKLSAGFKRNFKSLLGTPIDRHPFELMPVAHPVYPWTRISTKHSQDKNRAEDALVYAADNPDTRGSLRDWNDEYQSCKELPKKDIPERIQRDRAIYRVNTEFVEAATRGAIMVINKSIAPINPLDPEQAHMYIYNNIFFSFAVDSRDLYKDIGGDRLSYAAANNDIHGVNLYNLADIEGLHTILTAVIDYRGHRVVGQSIIPGILTNEKVSQVVYGSMDNGKTITRDDEFHQLVLKAGKFFNIGEHTVLKEDGGEVVIACAIDSKGIIGTDGRKYILDLVRPSPRDPNYNEPSDLMCVLRPELIAGYSEFLRMKLLKEREAAKAKANGGAATGHQEEVQEEKAGENDEEKNEGQIGMYALKYTTADVKLQSGALTYSLTEVQLNLNPNMFANVKLGGTPEKLKADEDTLKEVAKFLNEFVIAGLISDFADNTCTPVDGNTLTNVLHSRGVNIRYLGRIASLAVEAPVIQALCISEMILRAAKHLFTAHLRSTENYFLSYSIAHFLNCLLGFAARGGAGPATPPPALQPGGKAAKKKKNSPFALTRALLWESLITSVKTKFDFDLPKTFAVLSNHICYLRSFALKVGIQVIARDYNFESETPFTFEDVLELYPIVKHCNPRSIDARDLQDAGIAMSIQGRVDVAHDLLTESLAIIQQVHGPLHQDAALCESHLARLLYSVQDLSMAIGHQSRAVVINERVLGLDHHDTVHAYGNLALFCHQDGRTREALAFITRALYLGNLVCGSLHPDHGSTYTHIAMILQDLDKVDLAIEYLMEALKSNEIIFGKKHVSTTAVTCHNIAIAYNKIQKYKEAMLYQKRNYMILSEQLGDTDVRTKESNLWLNQFTTRAVQKQIEIKKADAVIQQLPKRVQKTVAEAAERAAKATIATPNNNPNPISSMPLADILRYVNSGSRTPLKSRGGSGIIKLSGGNKAAGNDSSAEQTQEESTPDTTVNGGASPASTNKKNKKKKNK